MGWGVGGKGKNGKTGQNKIFKKIRDLSLSTKFRPCLTGCKHKVFE